MAAFQKWVHSGGDGKSVEATLRLTRVTEEQHKDAGKFKTWSKILAHFGNAEEAERFRSMRRAQSKGTSVCRNTGEETFLLYDEEEVSWIQRKLDEVVFEVGADFESASRLVKLMEDAPQLFRKQERGQELLGGQPGQGGDVNPKPPGKPVGNPKTKAKAKAKAKAALMSCASFLPVTLEFRVQAFRVSYVWQFGAQALRFHMFASLGRV